MSITIVNQFNAQKWADAQWHAYEALAIIVMQWMGNIQRDGLLTESALTNFYADTEEDQNILRAAVKLPYYDKRSLFAFVGPFLKQIDNQNAQIMPDEVREWLMTMYCLAVLLDRYHPGSIYDEADDICHVFMQSGEGCVGALGEFGFLEYTDIGGNWTAAGRKLLAGDFS